MNCRSPDSGRSFFYDNPLEVFGNPTVKRQDWFSCSCCPPNVSRLFASFGGLIYFISNGVSNDPVVVVNLYSGSTVRIPVGEGKFATLIQETEYPREGEVRFKFEGLAPKQRVGLKLRIPGWATGYAVSSSLLAYSTTFKRNPCIALYQQYTTRPSPSAHQRLLDYPT